MSAIDPRSVLVVSDVHLSRRPSAAADALAELVHSHPSHELVVAGDFFDLALDPPDKQPGESMAEILSSHPALAEGLAERLGGGSPVTLLAGNHDAAIADTTTRTRLLDMLGLPDSAPLTTFPWFVRRGGVHIEHGHFYDPDNAPTHPLCLWSYQTEPLGVAMTRRFVAPNGAMMFAGAYEVTPLSGLRHVLSEYGLRAPLIIGNYFATAGGLCVRARVSGPTLRAEWQRGDRAMREYSEQQGLDVSVLEQLLQMGARPTHHRFTDTFMRLYFDRIFASASASGGLALALMGQAGGWLLLGLAASYLVYSVTGQGSRYRDLPGARLREAALGVQSATGATTVIFGHTHVEDSAPGYVNLGSYAFARGRRPYVEIDQAGNPRRLRQS